MRTDVILDVESENVGEAGGDAGERRDIAFAGGGGFGVGVLAVFAFPVSLGAGWVPARFRAMVAADDRNLAHRVLEATCHSVAHTIGSGRVDA